MKELPNTAARSQSRLKLCSQARWGAPPTLFNDLITRPDRQQTVRHAGQHLSLTLAPVPAVEDQVAIGALLTSWRVADLPADSRSPPRPRRAARCPPRLRG